jgi:predicted DNA-binding transcriptional regulator AlpA
MADNGTKHVRVVTPTALLQLPPIEVIDQLPVDELPALVAELAALQARAAMRLRRDPVPATDEDRLLTIDEAAERLALSKDWLRRRPELPFVVKLSDGVVRYSSTALTAYITRHRTR